MSKLVRAPEYDALGWEMYKYVPDEVRIFIVTSGSYSDYKIEGVFTDENVAGKFQALLDDGNVEKWQLDTVSDKLERGYKFYNVTMQKNGDSEVKQNSYDAYTTDISTFKYLHPTTIDERCFKLWAKDAQHAVKIVNEYRARMIADGTWDDKESTTFHYEMEK